VSESGQLSVNRPQECIICRFLEHGQLQGCKDRWKGDGKKKEGKGGGLFVSDSRAVQEKGRDEMIWARDAKGWVKRGLSDYGKIKVCTGHRERTHRENGRGQSGGRNEPERTSEIEANERY